MLLWDLGSVSVESSLEAAQLPSHTPQYLNTGISFWISLHSVFSNVIVVVALVTTIIIIDITEENIETSQENNHSIVVVYRLVIPNTTTFTSGKFNGFDSIIYITIPKV